MLHGLLAEMQRNPLGPVLGGDSMSTSVRVDIGWARDYKFIEWYDFAALATGIRQPVSSAAEVIRAGSQLKLYTAQSSARVGLSSQPEEHKDKD